MIPTQRPRGKFHAAAGHTGNEISRRPGTDRFRSDGRAAAGPALLLGHRHPAAGLGHFRRRLRAPVPEVVPRRGLHLGGLVRPHVPAGAAVAGGFPGATRPRGAPRGLRHLHQPLYARGAGGGHLRRHLPGLLLEAPRRAHRRGPGRLQGGLPVQRRRYPRAAGRGEPARRQEPLRPRQHHRRAHHLPRRLRPRHAAAGGPLQGRFPLPLPREHQGPH